MRPKEKKSARMGGRNRVKRKTRWQTKATKATMNAA